MTSRATVTFRNALIALLAAVCAITLLAASEAQAAITHPYTGISFGPGGVGSGSFNKVGSVAIDPRTGDVFVLNIQGGGSLFKFNADGEPVDFASTGTNVIEGIETGAGSLNEIAVDGSTGPAAGDIYVATYNSLRIYSESGKYLGELGKESSTWRPCGVAVDTSGNVYVSDSESKTIRRYAPSANPVTTTDENASMGGLPFACNIAVDGAGNVFAAVDYTANGIYEYGSLQFGSMAATGTQVDPSGVTLAIDPQNDELFTDNEHAVTQYDASVQPPALRGSTGGPGVSGELSYHSFGVAVSHDTGELYVGDQTNVEIFGPPEEAPGAITERAYYVTASQAMLRGIVEPAQAEVTSCTFEYHYESGHGSIPCEPAPPYTGTSVNVSAVVGGLQPGTTYQYKIVAVTSRGTYTGREESFTTAGPRIEREKYEGVGSKTATVGALIVAGEEPRVHYRVEYGTSTSYGSSTTSAVVQGEEESAKVHIGGLSSKTTYHFRFVAENQTATVYGPDLTFTTGNVIAKESFSQVTSEAAMVTAEIDPGGVPTSYVIEYGSNSSYGSSTSPISIGAGEGLVAITDHLSGLRPGATYHFRFIVSSESEVNSGEDLSLTTHRLSLPGLPDRRGYEMVTPVENEGAETYAPEDAGWGGEDSIMSSLPFAASTDGNAVAYVGGPTSAGNGSQGDGEGNEYLARRSTGGEWVQRNMQPAGYVSPEYVGFSTDLGQSVLDSREPLDGQGPPSPYRGLYVRDEANGFSPLFTTKPPDRTGESFQPVYVGASADFTHVLFEANDALNGEAVDPGQSEDDLYESVGGHLRLVNILPSGTVGTGASFGAKKEQTSPSPVDYSHVISADGSRVFWTNWRNLYVREDGTRTSLVREEAEYLTASSDGSKVLYTMEEGDLYEDNLETGTTEDVEHRAGVVGILGASEDLDYIYFVARGVLASGAEAGENNLYLLHDGETRYIATLGNQQREEAAATLYPANKDGSFPWNPDMARRLAEVTPSGHDVVFMSAQSLTGYENSGAGGKYGDEVYVYDAESSTLSCVSCDSTGEPPTELEFPEGTTGGFFAVSGYPTYQLHVISDDGARVFFQSAQPLLPQANNGKWNVYEWERDGSGSCQYVSGCLYLLSSGSSPYPSYFVDASASGNDVFFMTRSQLVRQDDNEYNDIYDAHVGAVEPPASPQCTGTGCQGVPASPPIFATPSSVTYNGVGNLAPVPVKAKPKTKVKPKPKVKNKCTVKKSRGKGKAAAKRAKASSCQREKTVRNGKAKKGSAR